MRWMIGLDLRNLAAGAVSFARWVQAQAPDHRFCGVHVVESLPQSLLGDAAPSPEEIREVAEAALAPLRDDGLVSELGAIEATAAEDGLAAACADNNSDALIIGRIKPTDEERLVRLGRVARRLMRMLPRPTVVVPPDLDVATIPDGPILLATDLGDASAGAARFAHELATALKRDLLVTYVVRLPDHLDVYLPSDAWSSLKGSANERSRESLARWIADHGLSNGPGEVRTSVVHGTPSLAIQDVAKVSSASVLVVGSRGLQTAQRLFTSSVGTELAAASSIPVAVVPATYR